MKWISVCSGGLLTVAFVAGSTVPRAMVEVSGFADIIGIEQETARSTF